MSPDPSLVRHWIALMKAAEGSAEHERLFPVFDHVQDLVEHDPESAWPFILAVLAEDDSPAIMETLSAGPLEDLLAKHGHAFIDRIELEAQQDLRFAALLGGVWKNAMSDDVWQRVQAVQDRRGWDGSAAE